eukprot:TRINITY_DN4903_c0_g1_i1.p1 TRINITY_DN4903_c0_g1~~TRINITY_DN4903_c0_g1_i1.p1  ORF type:complete len:656 (+),score=61.10 TRINITY_DN4903_c0_g1_i1:83-2050(+)
MSYYVFVWTCAAVELGICGLVLGTYRKNIAGACMWLPCVMRSLTSFCGIDSNTVVSPQLVEQIRIMRLGQFRILCYIVALIAFVILVSWQLVFLSDGAIRLPLPTCWTFMIWFVMSSILSIYPSLLERAGIDFWYAVFMALNVVNASSWHLPLLKLELWSYWLAVPRAVLALPVQRFSTAVLFNGLLCLHIMGRIVFANTDELLGVGESKRAQCQSQVMIFATVVACAFVVRQLLYTCERLGFEVKAKTVELSAASSLLEGLFDAVVEVDHELKIVKPSVALSSILLMRRAHTARTSQSMEGDDLMALFADPEHERVRQYMFSSHTFPITTQMVDSANNSVEVELVRVNYQDHSSELPCTLVGIREVVESQAADHRGPPPDISVSKAHREPTRRSRMAPPSLYFNAETFEVLGMNEAFAKLDLCKEDESFLDDIFGIQKHGEFYEFLRDACVYMSSSAQESPSTTEDTFYRCPLKPEGGSKTLGDVKLQSLEVLGTLTLSPRFDNHLGVPSKSRKTKHGRSTAEGSRAGSKASGPGSSCRGTPRIALSSSLGASVIGGAGLGQSSSSGQQQVSMESGSGRKFKANPSPAPSRSTHLEPHPTSMSTMECRSTRDVLRPYSYGSSSLVNSSPVQVSETLASAGSLTSNDKGLWRVRL